MLGILAALVAVYLAALFWRFRRRALLLLAAQATLLLGVAALLEAGGQLWALFHPAYRVLFLEPDRDLGWTLAPGLRFVWTGTEWYARDFSVPVTVNSLGFRDAERREAKPPGVVRIALLGDSYVEALQVPFEKTAGQLLQKRLAVTMPDRRFEVLNFGVSNYGIGQCLLVWERHVRRFAPDHVFLPVAVLHLRRTVTEHEGGAFPRTARLRLSVRPTFGLETTGLVRHPARDHERLVDIQRRLMEEEFGGGRITRQPPRLFLAYHAPRIWHAPKPWSRLGARGEALDPPAPVGTQGGVDPQTMQVNLALIQALGRDVRAHGGSLTVVDFVRFFDRRLEMVSAVLRRACRYNGFGYVDLSRYLEHAHRVGARTTWPNDFHFSEAGNQAFADALYGSLVSRLGRSGADAPRTRPSP
jgi:hypothetical protein